MSLYEDPIFDPWSSEELLGDSEPPEIEPRSIRELASRHLPEAAAAVEADTEPEGDTGPEAEAESAPDRVDELPHPLDLLQRLTVPRLEALSRELRLARHHTALHDLLDGPSRLLRFELTPWLSPLSARSPRPAVLEIGLASETDDRVTAWCWLDSSTEGPYKSSTVTFDKLTSAWIEHTILDFVVRVLGRR